MQKISRRQWLLRVGGAMIVPAFVSSCRPTVSDRVAVIGERLSTAYKPVLRNDCVGCDNCMPCPYGIDIPSNLLFADRAIADGFMPAELDSPGFPVTGNRFLTLYEAEIPDKAQSQRCISCGECVPMCPVGIDIPMRLSEITALTDVLRDLRCQQF